MANANQPGNDYLKQGNDAYNANDFVKAVELYRKAAEMGNTEAQFYLAECYELEKGIINDDEKARYWYTKSAEGGNAKAQYFVGRGYQNGMGIFSKDLKKALEWLTKAYKNDDEVEKKHAEIQLKVVNEQLEKLQKPSTDDNAIYDGSANASPDELFKQAEAISSDDEAKAVTLYRKAAEKGHVEAQYCLGDCYSYGTGMLSADKVEALKWYRKAAEQGHADAQDNMGFFYLKGKGTEKDLDQALFWYEKAAAQGSETAPESIEKIKQLKDNSARPLTEIERRIKEAEEGSSYAQQILGDYYRDGTGVPKDTAKACYWYEKAAAQGDDYAKTQLAKLN